MVFSVAGFRRVVCKVEKPTEQIRPIVNANEDVGNCNFGKAL